MPDETDAKTILTASLWENWKRPPGCPQLRGWRLSCRTWLETDVYVWCYTS